MSSIPAEEIERIVAAALAGDGHAAVMGLDDRSNNGQPEAGATT